MLSPLAMAAVAACATTQTAPPPDAPTPALVAQAMTQVCLPVTFERRPLDAAEGALFVERAPPPSSPGADVRVSYKLPADAFVFQSNAAEPDCNIYLYGGDTAALRDAVLAALATYAPPFRHAYCGPNAPRTAHRDALDAQASDGSWVHAVVTTDGGRVFMGLSHDDDSLDDLSRFNFLVPSDYEAAAREDTGFACN
jgi:hypothetical protein